MLALLSALASAAPTSPVLPAGEGFTLQVAPWMAFDRQRLSDPYCTNGGCDAVRSLVGPGVEIEVKILPFLGAWVDGGRFTERTDAILYAGRGYSLHGGLEGEIPLGETVSAVDLWVGGGFANSTSSNSKDDHLTSRELAVGAAWRRGEPADGGSFWLGVEAVPVGRAQAALGGRFALGLAPTFPGSILAGASLTSRPLGGVWSDRGRLEVGIAGAAGAHGGGRIWLGFGW